MTLLYRILVGLGSLALALVVGFVYGIKYDSGRADAATLTRLVQAERISSSLSAQLSVQRNVDEDYYTNLRAGIKNVPITPVVLPLGYISVYDRALVGPLSHAAGESLGETEGARASSVDTGSLLDNFTVNAERCVAIEQQLDALITWHEENDK